MTYPHYEVLWPGGESAVTAIPPASRPETLSGKRIGFLWDQMFRGDEIFPIIEREIRARFDSVEFVSEDQFGPTFGGNEHETIESLPNRLRSLGVDAVVSGIGA